MLETDDHVRESLRHVYWIGGGSGAGKSTVARRIAAEHGLRLYATDAVMHEHARRTTPEDAPYLHRFEAMDVDGRWVDQSPETMLSTFHWFRGEAFGQIVDDLLRIPAGTRVLAEGLRLLPHLVEPLLVDTSRAVWLLPTPRFREAAFDRRQVGWDVPPAATDRERGRRNLFERDKMFTDRLIEETARLGLPTIEVDTTISEDVLLSRIVRSFGL